MGSTSSREYAIYLCYLAAKERGFHVFVLQNGWCGGMRGSLRYQKFGKATNCLNGKGGSRANSVYQIGGKFDNCRKIILLNLIKQRLFFSV